MEGVVCFFSFFRLFSVSGVNEFEWRRSDEIQFSMVPCVVVHTVNVHGITEMHQYCCVCAATFSNVHQAHKATNILCSFLFSFFLFLLFSSPLIFLPFLLFFPLLSFFLAFLFSLFSPLHTIFKWQLASENQPKQKQIYANKSNQKHKKQKTPKAASGLGSKATCFPNQKHTLRVSLSCFW